MFLIIPVHIVDAGIFSIFSKIFSNGENKEKNTASVLNIQNMAILEAPLNPNPLNAIGGGDISIIGETALVSESGPDGTFADISETSKHNGSISLYTVRKGDTISSIAETFGVSVNTIAWTNDLKYTNIKEGQVLVILPINGLQHKVQKGDTLEKIAKKYKADLDEIKDFNGLLEKDDLEIGSTIIIPEGELDAPALASRPVIRGVGGPNYADYYIFPVPEGRKTQGLHGYNAVDVGRYFGAPIVASAPGEVILVKSSGWNGGYGNYIIIAHPNGTQTLYSHNSTNLVKVGDKVFRGQTIALMGSTGKSTGPHLHFEVRGAKNPF